MNSRKLIQSTSILIRRYCNQVNSKEEIDRIVKNSKVVLFMKGTPEEPMCGFSNVIAQILKMHQVKYESINVMDDPSVREGVKKYSEWPTIPQLFVDGKFIGGSDITLQMHKSGDLIDLLKNAGIKSALEKSSDQKDKK